MAGTLAGAQNARVTKIKKYGGYEKYLEHMRTIAKKGGSYGAKDGLVKGFAADRERARIAGQKGGQISRRVKNVQHTTV